MSYIKNYIDSKRKGLPQVAAVKQYDLPGLADTLSVSPEVIEKSKQEYNLYLWQLQQNPVWPDKKAELAHHAHMCRMLAKICTYTETEIKEGFKLDKSQCPF